MDRFNMYKKSADVFIARSRLKKGIIYGLHRCGADWDWDPGKFSNYDLWYVRAGTGLLQLNGNSYKLRKGSCFLFQPDHMPTVTQNQHDRLTVIYLHFFAEYGNGGAPEPGTLQLPFHFEVPDTYTFESMLYRLLDLCEYPQMWQEEEFDLLLKQTLLVLFRYVFESPHDFFSSREKTKHLRQLMHHIRNNIPGRLTDEEIIRITGFAPRYANLLFRKYFGLSIKQYMKQARLEKALHLLTETSINVSQTAHALGYSDLFYFSKQFKQRYGFPPSKCRKWNAGGKSVKPAKS